MHKKKSDKIAEVGKNKHAKNKLPFDHYVAEAKTSLDVWARYIHQKTGNKVPFEDARQEMLISAWKSYQSYDPSVYKFTTYAVHRMMNTAKTILDNFYKRPDALDLSIDVHMNSCEDDDEISYIDNIADDRPNPLESLIQQADYAEETRPLKGIELLDEIEKILVKFAEYEKSRKKKNLAGDTHALTIFRKLRYEHKRRPDCKEVPKTCTDVAKEMGLVVQRVSSIYTTRIAILGNSVLRKRIIALQATGQEVDMAKAKTKVVEAAAKVGRKPTKDGLQSKIDWLDREFCKKGKSRAQAIEALTTKYPDISPNYAKTLVYNKMPPSQGFEWAEGTRGRKATEEKATKGTKKPAGKTKAEAAPAKSTKKKDAPATKPKAAKKAAAEPEEEEAAPKASKPKAGKKGAKSPDDDWDFE